MDDPQHLKSWTRDRVLGAGGFGVVTLWENDITRQKVAIKKCRYGLDSMMTDIHKESWAREVDIMQRLCHLNVVKAIPLPYELQGITSELPLLCMEFCSGGDLRQILNKPENCCGLRESEVRCLLADLTAAVQYLHVQRITHRDLKPENIVLQEESNNRMIYKLIDLGYAKELDASSICSSFVGTMQYLAPEFFTRPGYSSSVDYWSLGLVSHEAITGVRPFLPNASSPVQWIPIVEKKSANDICIYNVPGAENEVKYSQQLFVENYISRCLREELEKWLRLALEWDPNKRGQTHFSKELTIFSMLDDILAKKIVTIFCVSFLECHSYQVDSATAVSTLQQWIERDTKLAVSEQLLLLPSGKPLSHNQMAIDCWDPNEMTMLYVFKSDSLTLPNIKVADRVPALVRWLMENPKEPLEYDHQKQVWKHAVFFLRKEYELFQLFLEAYAVKMLSLLEMSYQLSTLEIDLTSQVEQLTAMQTMSVETLEYDNKCYARCLSGVPSLLSMGSLIITWASEVNAAAHKVASYRETQRAMKASVQKVLQATAALQENGEYGQDNLTTFEKLLNKGYKSYDYLCRRKDKAAQSDSLDMVRILYLCFKHIDIAFHDQSFDTHLKQVGWCETELSSLLKKLTSLKQQVYDTKLAVMKSHLTRQKETWTIIQRLATPPEKESGKQKTVPSPNVAIKPQPTSAVPPPESVSSNNVPLKEPDKQNTIPSPNIAIKPQPTSAVALPESVSSNHVSLVPNLQRSVTNSVGSSHIAPNFDTSSSQEPIVYSPDITIQGSMKSRTKLIEATVPKSALNTQSLLQDNMSIRYAFQDSVVSFSQCSNSFTNTDLDWSYLDLYKN